jgi:hypothetical protein
MAEVTGPGSPGRPPNVTHASSRGATMCIKERADRGLRKACDRTPDPSLCPMPGFERGVAAEMLQGRSMVAGLEARP